MWWVRNGFTSYYQDGLSGYNFSNVGNAIIFQMTHDYVILDESLVVHRSAKVRDKI
jgi:hypothetical protein